MTSHRRAVTTLAAAAAIIGILAAGCGSGGDGETRSTDTTAAPTDSADDATTTTKASGPDGSVEETSDDACDLFSDDVAAEVLGVDIVRREGSTDPANGGVSCIKGTERADDPSQFQYVSVGVIPGGGSIMVEQFADQEGSEDVAGLGDRAVFVPNIGALIVVDGADAVQVQVLKAGVPSGLEDCVKVAEDVLDRRG